MRATPAAESSAVLAVAAVLVSPASAEATPPAPPSDRLVAALEPSMARVRTLGYRFFKIASKLTGDYLTAEDVDHLCRMAVFEAFLQLGGQVDAPEAFDFTAHTVALERLGLRALRHATLGAKSEYGAAGRRLSLRKDGAMVSALRWDAWTHLGIVGDEHHVGTDARRVTAAVSEEYVAPNPVEADILAERISTFASALEQVVSPTAFRWLIERYRDGVTIRTQAERLMAERPEYAGDFQRAANYIDQTISRARRKAAVALGAEWGALAADVEA